MAVNLKPLADGATLFVDSQDREIARMSPRFGFDSSPRNFAIWYDDFFGDALDARYNGTNSGTGTAPAAYTSTSAQSNGYVRLATATTNDASQLAMDYQWMCGNGGMMLEVYSRLTSATNVCAVIGFTDNKAIEAPFTISGTTITSNATDAACFVFDTDQTTDQWACLGVKADTDTALQLSGIAPTANVFQRFNIEIDNLGTAFFYIDGVLVATAANAVTTTVPLTPVVHLIDRTTTAKNLDVDYLLIKSRRA